jgi:hypothetical protein
MKRLLALGGFLAIACTAGCCNRPGLFNRNYYANYPYPQPTYTNPCACQPSTVQALPGPAPGSVLGQTAP